MVPALVPPEREEAAVETSTGFFIIEGEMELELKVVCLEEDTRVLASVR
jgi:hypothetical protein